ncbi:gliding motility-associated C-terminal domain-containing protein [Lacinutrix sp. C3R15]|uniref:T9SS type B sorting domain-containing protein n=1 Tax=Flavobacteriaceae TaxID=49546 RepID=UPI001C09110A|nr:MULTISPECIES: gliding motility-associated C-terminal domain-containing protein [Flavobacteriaceae]MBU2940825.1 gliding motility-associated C-terminal domain-containing protein [Lacinutrix sp. C3R15]MDO6624143.1 gliding motility-associated C-terminal domain-containing protein [Oceanihabitans sp. 1_MG-2023]
MKKITLSLLLGFMSLVGFSQVGLVENFDSGVTLPTGWTSDAEDYSVSFVENCDGRSVRANLDVTNTDAQLTSPNIVGESNGSDLTIAFDYKIVDWSLATTETQPGWGEILVQYSVDDGTNWVTVDTIDDSNHVTSNICANWSVVVPAADVPTGSDFKLRINTNWITTDTDVTYYLYLDNVSATQVVVDPPSCVNLLTPTNGSSGVSITTDLEWTDATGIPTGYTLSVGTTPGGTDVLDNVNTGLSTTYDLPDLEYGTTYYVTITPFNANGDAVDCTEYTFTTGADPNAPVDCASGLPINTVYCYGNSDTTTWNFQSSTGGPLNVFFNAGQMESCCDEITIYDGTDNTGTVLYDDNNDGDLTGVSVIATSGFVFIEIDSDSSISCAANGYIPIDFDVSCVDTTALPNCNATLTTPVNGAIDVDVNTDLVWSPASVLVTGYILSVGTTPGGTDVVDNVDVFGATNYTLGTLAYETTYYVTIVPYNDNGSAVNCNEQTFTTENDPNQIVDCSISEEVNTIFCYENNDNTVYSFASNSGAPLVVVFNSGTTENIFDELVVTDSDGTELYNGYGNGGNLAGLMFTSTGGSISIGVTSDGSVVSCTNNPWNFTVSCVDTTALPNCNASLTSPVNGAVDVNENEDLTWSAATVFVEGYYLSIGTTPGGVDVLDNLDVGNVLTYDPGVLEYSTTYYVTIVPYNVNGSAVDCVEESFTVKDDPNQIVDCDTSEVINTTFCYENNEIIELWFASSNGNPISISFLAGFLEESAFSGNTWDDLFIYDGTDNTGTLLYDSNDGIVGNSDLAGFNFVGNSGNLYIFFDADGFGSCESSGYTPVSFDVACVDTTALPNCNAALTGPVDGEIDVDENDDLTWSAASVIVDGYKLYIGTTPGGTDVLNGLDVGDVLTYDPGTLDYATTYYVTIVPYNGNGDATGCTEESFTTRNDPNVIIDCAAGPYNTTYCYGNNDPMVFYFASADGYPLNLMFNAGDIENFWDEIIVYDSDGSILFQDDNGGDLTGLTFSSTGSSISVAIDSDGSGSCQSSTGYTPWDFDVWCQTCIPQTVDFDVVGDCNTDPDNPEFNVEVNVTDFGDATSITVTDDQGSAPQVLTEPGVVVFGPYTANTEVILSAANTDDANCVVDSMSLTFVCPPAPNPCSIIYAGEDQTVTCDDPETDLTASFHLFGTDTNTYVVNALDVCPTPATSGGEPTSLDIDDTWSDIIELGFEFCFFGETYSQILIGSNGVLSFELENAGGYNAWGFTDSLPNSTNNALSEANIFGVAHDIDPSVCGDINYYILGSAPYRQFVVNYTDVCHFSCNSLTSSSQIILYESSNNIDVNVFDKPTCTTWNSGSAVIGVQNVAGTVAFTPPGRNTGDWSASDEYWRFAPSGGTPNYTFEWFDGTTSLGDTETITVSPTETTTYTASITYELCTGGTSTVTDDVVITFDDSSVEDATFTMTATCDGGTAEITGTTGGTFTFDPVPTDGALIDAATGTVTEATPGETYTVVYTTSGSCSATSSEDVTVLDAEDASFTVTAGCDGGTVVITGDAGGTFSFNPAVTDGTLIDPVTGEVTNALPGTSYTIEYTTSGVCSETSTQVLTTLDAFDFTVIGDCNGAIYELTINPANDSYDASTATYVLYDDMDSVLQTNTVGDNVFVIDASIFTPPMSGSSFNYVVEVTNDLGCVVYNDVLVESINCIIPQGISPNNDGKNDNFDLTGYDVSKLEIFNRHGIKVYSKTNYTNDWYGQSDSGDELPVGTYFYVMEYQGNKTKTSWVYLNREN